MRKVLLTFLLLTVSALRPAAGWADCVYLDSVLWPGDPPVVSMSVNPNGSTAGDPDGQVAAIRRAMEVWNTDGGASISFSYAGTTTSTFTNTPADWNGESVISFYNGVDPWLENSGTLGFATMWSNYNFDTGTWYNTEAEVVIFTQFCMEGSACPTAVEWYTGETLPVPSGEDDLQSAVEHELGHVMSLGHPPPPEVPGANIMNASDETSSVRVLGDYDRDCLQALYPPPPPPSDGSGDPGSGPSSDPPASTDDPPAADDSPPSGDGTPPADSTPPPSDSSPPSGDGSTPPPSDDSTGDSTPGGDDQAAAGDDQAATDTPADDSTDSGTPPDDSAAGDETPPPADDGSAEKGDDSSGGSRHRDNNICFRYPYPCIDKNRLLVVSYCDLYKWSDPLCTRINLCDRYPQICRFFKEIPR